MADGSRGVERDLGILSAAGHTPEEASTKFASLLEEKGGYNKPTLPKSAAEAMGQRLQHDNSPFAQDQINKIEEVYGKQPALLAALKEHGGRAEIHSNKSVGEHPWLERLNDVKPPTSYRGTGISSMGEAGGVYVPAYKTVAINGAVPSGTKVGVGPHEFGHMVDHALSRDGRYFSDSSSGMDMAQKQLKEVGRDTFGVQPHYLLSGEAGRHEIFGETFPAYLRAKRSGDSPASRELARSAIADALTTSQRGFNLVLDSKVPQTLLETYDDLMKKVNHRYGV